MSRAGRMPWWERCCARRIVPIAASGVIFFNNVGVLGMCGHGTIGLIASLAYLGQLAPGRVGSTRPWAWWTPSCVPTAVSPWTTCRATAPRAAWWSTCRAWARDAATSRGAATGSSWCASMGSTSGCATSRRSPNSPGACARPLNAPGTSRRRSRRVVRSSPRTAARTAATSCLCPGEAYDRSPCGTGTSAKLACLAADGEAR